MGTRKLTRPCRLGILFQVCRMCGPMTNHERILSPQGYGFMVAAYHYRGTPARLMMVSCLVALGLATGCCGPMACGPVGCGPCGSGPLMAAGSCGGGCRGCDGCGERYIDEWINHPPTCDPCDACGNHNGQSCTACRPMFEGIKSLWGYRRDCGCESTGCGCESAGCDSHGCGGGCESCGDGHASMAGEEMGHHYVDSSSAIPMPHMPSPAPQIVEAKPAIKPYQPQRTKQIFRPKGSVAGNVPQPRGY